MSSDEFLQRIRNNTKLTERIIVGGNPFEFDVVKDSGLEQMLSFFIGYNNGRPFISSEVPVDYRIPMVTHEIMEFTAYLGKPDSCLNALKDELKLVPAKQLEEYITFRYHVFKILRNYLMKTEPSSPLIDQVRTSMMLLEGKLRSYEHKRII